MGSKDTSKDLRIIIVGGGIAGLSAAIALRSPNRKITILERSHLLRETGALISLQPNASKIVTGWGLDPLLQRVAEPQPDSAFRLFNAAEGKLVRSIPLDASQFGAERMLYHRQDLHSALREAATEDGEGGAEVRTGAGVKDCDPENGTVTLENGEVLEADLIIGADGIKSGLRNIVVNDSKEHKPLPTGLSAYRLLIPASNLPIDELPADLLQLSNPAATTMIVGPDRRIIMGPGRGGKILGVVALVPDSICPSQPTESWTQPASKAALLDAYKDFPAWLHKLFDAAAEDEVSLWQLRDIDPLPTWYRGRVMLVGDAAHAMLPTQGQGASQAVEDAEALQAYVKKLNAGKFEKEDVEAVLKEVFEARYERASLIQAYSREQARPGAAGKTVTLDPGEFLQYNCVYDGAVDWVEKQRKKKEDEKASAEREKADEAAVLESVEKLKLVEAN